MPGVSMAKSIGNTNFPLGSTHWTVNTDFCDTPHNGSSPAKMALIWFRKIGSAWAFLIQPFLFTINRHVCPLKEKILIDWNSSKSFSSTHLRPWTIWYFYGKFGNNISFIYIEIIALSKKESSLSHRYQLELTITIVIIVIQYWMWTQLIIIMNETEIENIMCELHFSS